jgi:hypothetical protein
MKETTRKKKVLAEIREILLVWGSGQVEDVDNLMTHIEAEINKLNLPS